MSDRGSLGVAGTTKLTPRTTVKGQAVYESKGKLTPVVLILGLLLGGAGSAGFYGGVVKTLSAPTAEAQAPVPNKPADASGKKEKAAALDLYGDPLPEGALLRFGTVRLRQSGQISGVAFSPDGKLLASITDGDETIRLWDVKTGAAIRVIKLPGFDASNGVAFSPDGSKLIVGWEKSVRIWDVETGRMVFQQIAHDERVSGVAFSPDGLRFASVGGNVVLWNTKTDAELFNWQPVANDIERKQGLAFSPDGKLVAASRGVDLHVWDASSGDTRLIIPKANYGEVISLIFQENNTLISSGSGHICFWDVTTEKKIREFEPIGIRYGAGIALSKDGKFLARAALDRIDILHAATGKIIQTFSDYYNPYGPYTNQLAFSPDGKILASVEIGNEVRLWDLATGKRVLDFAASHSGRIISSVYSPDGSKALTTAGEGAARLWDSGTTRQLRLFSHDIKKEDIFRENDTVALFSPDGKWIATGGQQPTKKKGFLGSCAIWDTVTGQPLFSQDFPGRVTLLCFAPDGKSLAIAALAPRDRNQQKTNVYVLPLSADGKLTMVGEILAGPAGRYASLAFSGNGKSLAMIDQSMMRIWDLAAKKQRAEFALPALTSYASFSPDGKTIVTGKYGDDRLFVSEASTGRIVRIIRIKNAAGNAIAFSSDGRILATCQISYSGTGSDQFDGLIHLWDILTGKEFLRINPPPGTVSTLAFSPDGRTLLTGCIDGTALTWNLKPKSIKPASPQELETFWKYLLEEDAARAYAAIWAFNEIPEICVPFLKAQLKPASPFDQTKIQKWIAELDSETFAVRQAAAQELVKVGVQVRPPIQKALEASPSLETRRRLEQILKSLADVPGPETIRTIRAIIALERIGTAEARDALQALAGGAPGARETEEAKGALERLSERFPKKR